jgi:hypothetical protein
MGSRRAVYAVAIAVLFALATAAGCGGITVKTGELRTESQTVALEEARTAGVEIKQGVGELKVSGGAKNLLDATFTYNVDAWKPEISYSVSGDRGSLVVKQPTEINVALGDQQYEWDLRLRDAVPISLQANLGAGKAALDLSSLTLQSLAVNTGAGEVTVDLGTYASSSFTGTVKGGAGKLTLILPKDVGVSVKADTGIGKTNIVGLQKKGEEYVNDAYGKTSDTLSLTIQAGVGEVNVQVAP